MRKSQGPEKTRRQTIQQLRDIEKGVISGEPKEIKSKKNYSLKFSRHKFYVHSIDHELLRKLIEYNNDADYVQIEHGEGSLSCIPIKTFEIFKKLRGTPNVQIFREMKTKYKGHVGTIYCELKPKTKVAE